MSVRLELGDCLDVLPRLHDAGVRVDSVVTDPPYHLASIVSRLGSPDAAPIQSGATGVYARSSAGFMGQQWDGGDVAFRPETWRLVYAVLKPGAHLVAFGGTRTYHRMVCAIEDAGFEIRDQLAWLYGTGFPKSHNLDGEWEGWGSALKPAQEPIVLARKPMIGSIPENVGHFATGALNIDSCRIHAADALGGAYTVKRLAPGAQVNATGDWKQEATYHGKTKPGRWPANVMHDGSEEVLAAFAAYGERGAAAPASGPRHTGPRPTTVAIHGMTGMGDRPPAFHPDSGTAARFFYSAKAAAADRAVPSTQRSSRLR